MDCNPPGTSVHGDSPVKNTGADCHTLLQGIFPTQGSNPGLPHCRQILYHLSHQGSPQSNDLVNVDNYCLLCSHPCSWNSLNSAYTGWFKYDPDWCYYEVVHCLSFSICLFPLSTEWTDNSLVCIVQTLASSTQFTKCFSILNQPIVPCPVLLLLDLRTGFTGSR